MSDQTNKQNHNADEIDIIQFFSYLGRGIKNFFKAIGNFFQWIFHVFILLLILIRTNLVYFIAALVVGLVAGFSLDYMRKPVYVSQMVVEPNYNSAQQLYNQVAFFNELAISKDSVALAKELKIDAKQAGKIVGVEIEPYITEKQKLFLYDEFIKELDTLTRNSFDYEMYSNSFNDLDAAYHIISVRAKDNNIAKSIEKPIVASVSETPYFKGQELTSNLNRALQDTILRKQLRDIDSLQDTYRKAMIAAASNTGSASTSISLDNKSSKIDETELFKYINEIKRNLVDLNIEKATEQATLNIISEFPDKGLKVQKLRKSMKVVLPIFLIIVVFVVLLLGKLNTYLKTYNK
ncbi:hypothetical protein [Neptunitalea lumnitzerae]|uniref:Polysaccharide chain length determinant N-terminal domain-containing protein n=1 Tax=Neptunitalea lumnitzerae TaxID=2965509 RepID=A0ABQ5MGV4_9FLAO|nr:hypothetical protein [Neptunitalea sp. Y10]GLB48147.1 hypothetical protein Y10_05150 [Neptunitalea sp. Y10]